MIAQVKNSVEVLVNKVKKIFLKYMSQKWWEKLENRRVRWGVPKDLSKRS